MTNLNSPIWSEDSQTAKWQTQSRWKTQAQINDQQVIQLSLGLPILDAQTRLSKFLSLNTYQLISMQPAWWPRLPFLPFRISVNYHD